MESLRQTCGKGHMSSYKPIGGLLLNNVNCHMSSYKSIGGFLLNNVIDVLDYSCYR